MPFSEVSHVAHFSSALDILRDKAIRAGLVYDESKLNKDRILVSWLSPNYWGTGFRYGTVQFSFNWESICESKNCYWVESIPYSIKACRILLTSKSYENLRKYDPRKGDGPWWYDKDSNTHYFNNRYCLEFMIEDDLDIRSDAHIDFVKHHPQYCSAHRYNPSVCRELGMSGSIAAAFLVSGLIARRIRVEQEWFVSGQDEASELPSNINSAWSWLWIKLVKSGPGHYEGNLRHTDPSAVAVARACCDAFFYGIDTEVNELRSLFKTKKDFAKSLAKVTAKQFDITNWRKLYQA
jgi:hypothetical protein